MFSPEDDPGLPVEVPVGFDQKPAGAAVGDDGMGPGSMDFAGLKVQRGASRSAALVGKWW